MIVLDASAAIDLLLNSPLSGARIAQRVAAEGTGIIAPHLIDAEVGQVLRRFLLAQEISVQRARAALTDFAQLRIARYPHLPLLERAFALRANTSFYDALYLALAEAVEAPLVTCDGSLARIPGVKALVEVL
jgi:predicted nucleic acid-binding protein